MQKPAPLPEMRNLIIAVVLSTFILLGWQLFIEEPKREAALAQAKLLKDQPVSETILPTVEAGEDAASATPALPADRNDLLKVERRVTLQSDVVHGSVTLKGLRLDDLTLADYKETLAPDSKEVELLSPIGTKNNYFAEFGWLSGSADLAVPNADTIWESQQDKLAKDKPLVASWDNGAGLSFEQTIAISDNYLFEVKQTVTNRSDKPVILYPYGLISRSYEDMGKHFFILHEGPLGVFNDTLAELKYEDLKDQPKQSFKTKNGWLGITDKYWLTALVPDQNAGFSANISHFKKEGSDKYQVDYRGAAITIAPGETTSISNHLFAGAKQVSLLDRYGKSLQAPLFDRAVDFGMLYFLTKPIFYALQYFFHLLGNFGLAILLLTVCIKLLLFPLANKSFSAMSQMKLLMPKITEIRERCGEDKMLMNKEIMELYKREKVNPASGCLPMLLQLPVFFALYKVLFVTIEMRHAPFYGWIDDLSAPDPTSVFNLFGLFPWDVPTMLMIGAWPLIMCATMVIQQRLNPKPADATQAMVMQWLPFIFLFLFASFPAGLIIYWAWSNCLSILQQWVISRRHQARYQAANA